LAKTAGKIPSSNKPQLIDVLNNAKLTDFKPRKFSEGPEMRESVAILFQQDIKQLYIKDANRRKSQTSSTLQRPA